MLLNTPIAIAHCIAQFYIDINAWFHICAVKTVTIESTCARLISITVNYACNVKHVVHYDIFYSNECPVSPLTVVYSEILNTLNYLNLTVAWHRLWVKHCQLMALSINI